MNEVIMRKIRKLLALSGSPQPAEARSARNKAAALMERHGLTMEELDSPQGVAEKVICTSGRVLRWESALLTGILDYTAAEALFVPSGREEKIILVGRRDRIVRAEKLYGYLREELIRLGEDYRPVIRDVESFRLGMAQAVCRRLKELNPAPPSPPTGRAVVPSAEDAAAEEADRYIRETFGSPREHRDEGSFDPNSLGLGRAVGRKISLLTQLENL